MPAGQQLEKAAANDGQQAADVRGPHAALAVKLQVCACFLAHQILSLVLHLPVLHPAQKDDCFRMQRRDKGRSFVLGERLQYVLLPGERLQDEAAEDPLTAALQNRVADTELYWRAKLQRPLQELFATCLSNAALQARLSPILSLHMMLNARLIGQFPCSTS